jgi:hypothetical protein
MTLCGNSFCRVVLLWLSLSSTTLAPLQLYAQQRQTFPFGKCQPDLSFRPIPKGGQRVLEPGSIIVARLREPLTSKKAKVGQRVVAFVSTAIADEKGVLLVPRNSRIIGQIDRVYRARSNQPALLEIGFNTLQRCSFLNAHPSVMANGANDEACSNNSEFLQLSGMMVPLTEENCKHFNDDGLLVGKKPGAKNTLKFVGAGAAGGALLGGLAVATLTGTGIGAGVGAGIGLVLALTSKGKDVSIEPGALFGIELTSPLPLRAQDQALTYPKPPPPPKPKPKPKPRPRPATDNNPSNPSNPFPPGTQDPVRQRMESISVNLNRLLNAHSQYLTINRQDMTCSRTLRALTALRKPLNDFFRTNNSQAQKQAVSQLFDGAIVVNDTINDERGQTCRLSETNATRWQNIQNAINEVAGHLGVNL